MVRTEVEDIWTPNEIWQALLECVDAACREESPNDTGAEY
jgi:sugar (pentulose or hexulose) kinase